MVNAGIITRIAETPSRDLADQVVRIYDSQALDGGRVKLETGDTVTGREEVHAISQQWRRLWNTSATAGGSVVSELLSAFADNEHKKSSVRVRDDLTPSD